MADNTVLNLGTGGDTIATDDIGGVKHQYVKVEFGAADTATPVSAVNPLPVVQTGANNVVNAGTFAVQAAATLAAETTKVIGTVNVAAAQTLATVTTVGTVSSVTAIANALPAGANAIGKLAANSGVDIGDVDVTTVGTITPGTGATNLGKAEDAPHADGDVGVMALAVRRDANTTLAGATGDYAPIQVDASGNLKVAIISGAGSGGTSIADAAAFTRATTSVTPIAGVVETSAPTVTNGNTSVLSLTTGGAVRVDVSSGGISGVTEDVASAGGEQGVLTMAVRQDTIASSTSTDGDFGNLKINSVGRLYAAATIDAAIPAGTNNIGDVDVLTVPTDPFGANADAASATGSISAKLRFIAATGIPVTGTVTVASHAVTNAGTFATQVAAVASGGYTPVSVVSAASTNATTTKASAGTVGAVTVTSVNAAMRYLKFYNKASNPTVGTDTPVYVFPIPGNTAGAGSTLTFDRGLNFSTGIAWALTTGAAVADTGAVSASEHIVSIAFI